MVVRMAASRAESWVVSKAELTAVMKVVSLVESRVEQTEGREGRRLSTNKKTFN